MAIRINGYAGNQFVVGLIAGLVVGLISFYYSKLSESDSEKWGLIVGFGTIAILDACLRVKHIFKKRSPIDLSMTGKFPLLAIIDPDEGGTIWYIPTWLVCGSVTIALMRIGVLLPGTA